MCAQFPQPLFFLLMGGNNYSNKKIFRIFHIIPKETDSLLLSLIVFVHSGYGLWIEVENSTLWYVVRYAGPYHVPFKLFTRVWSGVCLLVVSFHFIVNGFSDTLCGWYEINFFVCHVKW
jgi:hypothetical protein